MCIVWGKKINIFNMDAFRKCLSEWKVYSMLFGASAMWLSESGNYSANLPFTSLGQRGRVDQKNSLSPDFIVKQCNNPQADTQLQFTYTPALPWHEKLSCIV